MKTDPNQLELFALNDPRRTAEIIDLVPIIVRTMPDFDPVYPEPAKIIRPEWQKRGAA